MTHVDAQDLTEKIVYILRAVSRVIAGAPVPGSDVKKSIRPECNHAAVMVGKRLWDCKKSDAAGLRHIRVRSRDAIFRDNRCPIRPARVVDEESAVVRIARVE